MTNVEQIQPGFQWAEPFRGKELEVERMGSDVLVSGLVPTYKNKDSPCDLVRLYEKSHKQVAIGQQSTGTQSPEVCFANADSDDKLIDFVRRFGPVVANCVKDTRLLPQAELDGPRLPWRLTAVQDMQELRNEHTIYRAAFALIMHLDQETQNYVSAQPLMLAIDATLTEELEPPKYDAALAQQLGKIIFKSVTQQLDRTDYSDLSARKIMGVTAQKMKEQLDHRNYVSAQQLLKVIAANLKRQFDQPVYDYFSAQKLIGIIATNVRDWPRQWERERSARQRWLPGAEPNWKLSAESLGRIESLSSPHRDQLLPDDLNGRIVICELLNSFRSMIFPNPCELHSSINFGIRPLLYALLRSQFLNPRGSGVCQNSECRNFFNIERSGQQFCSPECSRHHRQRIYWQKRGKKLRKKRTTQRRKES